MITNLDVSTESEPADMQEAATGLPYHSSVQMLLITHAAALLDKCKIFTDCQAQMSGVLQAEVVFYMPGNGMM